MTAKDVEGAMEIECALGEQRRAAERAKWFRAGLEAAAHVADVCAESYGAMAGVSGSRTPCAVAKARTAEYLRDKILSLPIPESDNG